MKEFNNIYIALGSNSGHKFINLQNAVDSIFKTIGTIASISRVYETEAYGFEGDFFLNACIGISTPMTAEQVLDQLLIIEKQLGRTRPKSNRYSSRIIDLDLIFFDQYQIHTKKIQVPHPELHKRKFVLQPLNDIASSFRHPDLNHSINTLLQDCKDQSMPKGIKQRLKNPIKSYSFSAYSHIVIEGNIGSGKTSLSTKIAKDFNAKLILERFTENSFLSEFYKNPKRHAFRLEMSFLVDRYQQISEDLVQLGLFENFIVSDYDIYKSLVFSRITLDPDEFKLYQKLFDIIYKDCVVPDLYVYLYQNIDQLQANIKKRGRAYEVNISNEYLEKINTGYLNFLKSQLSMNTKIIDISNRDFVNRHEDYLWLLEKIGQ